MTPRMQEVLHFIDWYSQRNKGVMPTYHEIAQFVGMKSSSNVHRVLKALEQRGFIKRIHAHARAIEILKLS